MHLTYLIFRDLTQVHGKRSTASQIGDESVKNHVQNDILAAVLWPFIVQAKQELMEATPAL